MDVSRYANDNDQEYCYRGTAGDACRLQHYTLPGGCNEKEKLVVTFLATQAASLPLRLCLPLHSRTRFKKMDVKRKKGGGREREREIGEGSFRIHIVTERVIHTRRLMAV